MRTVQYKNEIGKCQFKYRPISGESLARSVIEDMVWELPLYGEESFSAEWPTLVSTFC